VTIVEQNYKIHLVSNNENLRRKLLNVTYFQEVIMDTSLDEIKEEITIIDDKIININDLLKNADKITSNYIFYKITLDNFKFSTKSILESNNIIMLQPYMTEENIVEYICSEIIKKNNLTINKNIVTFFGADSKVGTTQVAQCIAEKIVEKSDARVCLVFLDGEAGTDYIDIDFKNNIDTIKIKLISELATTEEIFDIAEKIKENFYIIEGTKSILYRKEYQPKHIEYLLNTLSIECDLVVIDAGSNIDRAMPISALTATNHRYLVTTQQKNSLRRYMEKKPILEKLSLDDFQLIVNKHIPDGSLPTAYDVSKLYEQPYLSKIEFCKYALQAENDRKSLIHYNDKDIIKDINKLADTIINQNNLGKKDIPKKRKWLNIRSKG
jgi:Flp pilus assembly CpaE family ATPase